MDEGVVRWCRSAICPVPVADHYEAPRTLRGHSGHHARLARRLADREALLCLARPEGISATEPQENLRSPAIAEQLCRFIT